MIAGCTAQFAPGIASTAWYRCGPNEGWSGSCDIVLFRVKWCASNGEHACGEGACCSDFFLPPHPLRIYYRRFPPPPFDVLSRCLQLVVDAWMLPQVFTVEGSISFINIYMSIHSIGQTAIILPTGLKHCLKLEKDSWAGSDHVCQSTDS